MEHEGFGTCKFRGDSNQIPGTLKPNVAKFRPNREQGTIGAHMPSNVQGTFNYMSPEAFDPEQFGGVTCRADSWYATHQKKLLENCTDRTSSQFKNNYCAEM